MPVSRQGERKIKHRQEAPREIGKNAAVKYCPSCGQRFPAGELHVTHDPKQCRLILRAQRNAESP
jgi:hypothetical protein